MSRSLVVLLVVIAGCSKAESRDEMAFSAVEPPVAANAAAPAPRDRDKELDLMLELLDKARALEVAHRFDEAEAFEVVILAYFQRVGDDYMIGMLHAKLGLVGESQRHWSAANEHYRQALAIFVQLRAKGPLDDEGDETQALITGGIARTEAGMQGRKN